MADRFNLKVCALAASACGFPALAQVEFETVVLSGAEAPGAGGRSFWLFNDPAINDAGQLAIPGYLQGPTIGIWRGSSAALELVALGGTPAPGTANGTFDTVWPYSIDDDGQIAVGATLVANPPMVDGSNDSGLWQTVGSSLQLVAREGESAIGNSGALFADLNRTPPVLSKSGTMGFFARLSQDAGGVDVTSDSGLWMGFGNGLALVAREGADAPGANGADFADLAGPPFFFPVINAGGTVAFRANLQAGESGVIFRQNDSGIWAGAPGALNLVARRSAVIPGTNGLVFDYIGSPSINDAGMLAFPSGIQSAASDERHAVWTHLNGVWTLAARSGFAAPGTGGAVFDSSLSFKDPVLLNAAGELAFAARLDLDQDAVGGGNDSAIWSGPVGSLRIIAREGTPAPGADGARFGELRLDDTSLVFNAAGDLAFTVYLQSNENGAGPTTRWSLWAYNRARNALMLIARAGDVIDVNTDPLVTDLRTIHSIDFEGQSGLQDGRRAGMNNRGQIAYRLLFTDSTEGIFLASLHGPCACDLDGTSGVNLFDLLAYLQFWFSTDPQAEFDGGFQQINVFDLLAYLDCWFPASSGGCP